MPEYTLRNVDPQLWSRFTERANLEGWPIKALIISLLESYATGETTPSKAAPTQLPEWAWLREHYNEVSKSEDFAALVPAEQWRRLIDQILRSDAAMSWRTLEQVPLDRQGDILHWLYLTKGVEIQHLLTLRAIASVGEGPDLRTNRRVFQYEVIGLPRNQQAWIADYSGGWRILRVIDGKQGEWSEGPHKTKEAALNTLAQQLDQPDPTIQELSLRNDVRDEEFLFQFGTGLPSFDIGHVTAIGDKRSAEIRPRNNRSIFHVRYHTNERDAARGDGVRHQLEAGLG